jgi:hypothetical protein
MGLPVIQPVLPLVNPLTNVIHLGSASGSGANWTIPSYVAAGDFAFVLQYAENASSIPALVTPSGFTSLGSATLAGTNFDSRVAAAWKILQAGDASSVITGMNGNQLNLKRMHLFRWQRGQISTVTVSIGGLVMTTANPALQTVNIAGQATPILVIGYCDAFHADASFTTENPLLQKSLSGWSHSVVKYSIYQEGSTPVNQQVDMGDVDNNMLGSWGFRFTS